MAYDPKEPLKGKTIASLCLRLVAEEHLTQPTIIYEFPTAVSPLSKQKPDEPEWTERGKSLRGRWKFPTGSANSTTRKISGERFEAQLKERERGDDEAHQMDEDYIRALSYGMPPAGGCGRGRGPPVHAADRLTHYPRRDSVSAAAAGKRTQPQGTRRKKNSKSGSVRLRFRRLTA
jgi:hypothetical protein